MTYPSVEEGEESPSIVGAIPTRLPSRSLGKMPRSNIEALYNRVAFLNQSKGLVLNTHITISYLMAGITDHKVCASLNGKILHEAGKWLTRGDTTVARHRRSFRQLSGASELHYIYVHENTRDMGFHTHVLATVTRPQIRYLAEWFRIRFANLCRGVGAGDSLPKSLVAFRWHQSPSEEDNIVRQWLWFRYISKTLDPELEYYLGNGECVSIREVFGTDKGALTGPIKSGKRVGWSHSIGEGAAKAVGFASAASRGDFSNLYSGREIREFHLRKAASQIDGEWS